MERFDITLEPVAFDALAHWCEDDHEAAFSTFLTSARRLAVLDQLGDARLKAMPAAWAGMMGVCRRALKDAASITTPRAARAFFEDNFAPHRAIHRGPAGLLTGYYEPILEGARTRSERFSVPLLRRPPDLVNLVTEAERGARADGLTHARRTAMGDEPYPTRAEIENGALDPFGLEFLWLEDPVDAFFLHIQGSGLIVLPDGTPVRITYDGKNGHPYTSVGRAVIDSGAIAEPDMTLDALKNWLRADRNRGRVVMQLNRSYVFFRELIGEEARDPMGVMEISLAAGRSLAVDTAYHGIGTPIWVSAPDLKHAGGVDGFHRLMIAQDVGSAIRGPERGDIYFGTGEEAGRLAGITKHGGQFFVLRPRADG